MLSRMSETESLPQHDPAADEPGFDESFTLEPDELVGTFTDEQVEDLAEEKPKRQRRKKPAPEPAEGVYVLEPGDHPSGVARKLYGRGSLATTLVKMNPHVKWTPGTEIKVP